MKRLTLLLAAMAVLVATTTVQSLAVDAINIKLDIGQALPGYDYGDADDFTGVFNQFTFKAQTTTTQYTDDTFVDKGDLYVTGYQASTLVDMEGLNQAGGHEFTAHWNAITGYVSEVDNSDPTNVKSTLIYTGGVIGMYVDAGVDRNFHSSYGAGDNTGFDNGILVATIEVVSGIGFTYFDTTNPANPMTQGHTDFVGQVTWALDDFWYNEFGEDLNDKYVSFGWLLAIADQNRDHIVTDHSVFGEVDGDRTKKFQILSDHDGSLELNASPEEQPGECRVTAGGNKDGLTTPCMTLDDGLTVVEDTCANDTNGNHKDPITNTWGGQAGAQPAIDCNWSHHLKSEEGSFGFHSNKCFYIQCSDPGPDCVSADGKPETRQIDFSGRGRFTHKNGVYETFPDCDLCFMVHLEDIGEPGRGGRWPSATDDCTHCPGTQIQNGPPQEDCKNCTDYYQIVIYDTYDPDPGTGYCRGNVLWVNGGPVDQCPDAPIIAPNPPYDDGFPTRAGNVQMHPDNNGAPIFNSEVFCNNGVDDDGDGKVDCNDKADCKNDPACQ